MSWEVSCLELSCLQHQTTANFTHKNGTGHGDLRAPVAVRDSPQLTAFAFSKLHTTYTQLRNEVLISPVKLKETLTVNYVFTWDFCWLLNVNLHVQITCRRTALHITQFTYAHGTTSQTNTCPRSFSSQSFATFSCTTASYR
jgi:hypothetical protein